MSLIYKEESYKIRGAAFDVYKELGCGHKEIVYQKAFLMALTDNSLIADREKRLNVFFRGKKVGTYVPDFLVSDKIIIEIKAKSMITKQDTQQF
jgi:GxxExxY protein